MLETLDYTIRTASTPTTLLLDCMTYMASKRKFREAKSSEEEI